MGARGILASFGVLLIMFSFYPMFLGIIRPPEEYDKPLSLVGMTENVVEHIFVFVSMDDEPSENRYLIYVDEDLFELDIVSKVYFNGIDITDNLKSSEGCIEIEVEDNTLPNKLEFVVFGKKIVKIVPPQYHGMEFDCLTLSEELQSTGSVLAHFTPDLKNGRLYASAPGNLAILENENRFIITPENEFYIILFDLIKSGDNMSGRIGEFNDFLEISGRVTNFSYTIDEKRKLFTLDMSAKLDENIADEIWISSIGASVWLENVKYVSMVLGNKKYYTITDICNLSLDFDSTEYWGGKFSIMLIQPMIATIVTSAPEKAIVNLWLLVLGLMLVLVSLIPTETLKSGWR